MPKYQLIINSTNSPTLKKRWGPSLQLDYEGWMIAVPIYRCYTPSSLKFGTTSGDLAANLRASHKILRGSMLPDPPNLNACIQTSM